MEAKKKTKVSFQHKARVNASMRLVLCVFREYLFPEPLGKHFTYRNG